MCRLIRRIAKLLSAAEQGRKQRLYVSDHFRKTALKYPNKAAIVFEDRQLTFREVDELSNRIANILRGTGLHHGNTAAVFMENSLEYLPVFLAICKLGVTGMMIINIP
jgi:fatty-acyl-CoA synthase